MKSKISRLEQLIEANRRTLLNVIEEEMTEQGLLGFDDSANTSDRW